MRCDDEFVQFRFRHDVGDGSLDVQCLCAVILGDRWDQLRVGAGRKGDR